MTSYLASCGDGSGVVPPPPPPPAPTQTLAECASVNVVTTNNGIDAYDEATAYYSGCEGSVSVQINVVNTQTRNLEPDGTCGSIRNGDTIGPNLGLPRNYTVNQMYSCGIDVDFIFTRGSETHTISETLWEDSEEACQVDTGSNRC